MDSSFREVYTFLYEGVMKMMIFTSMLIATVLMVIGIDAVAIIGSRKTEEYTFN